jgi:hypothetical protein
VIQAMLDGRGEWLASPCNDQNGSLSIYLFSDLIIAKSAAAGAKDQIGHAGEA